MADEPIFEGAPGEKIEDNRSRLAIFFGVLYRKFWKLITVNLMFLVFNIPAIIISYFLSVYLVALFIPEAANIPITEFSMLVFDSGFPTAMFFGDLLSGWSCPGRVDLFARCYSWGTFQLVDFKDKMKENMKQGINET